MPEFRDTTLSLNQSIFSPAQLISSSSPVQLFIYHHPLRHPIWCPSESIAIKYCWLQLIYQLMLKQFESKWNGLFGVLLNVFCRVAAISEHDNCTYHRIFRCCFFLSLVQKYAIQRIFNHFTCHAENFYPLSIKPNSVWASVEFFFHFLCSSRIVYSNPTINIRLEMYAIVFCTFFFASEK